MSVLDEIPPLEHGQGVVGELDFFFAFHGSAPSSMTFIGSSGVIYYNAYREWRGSHFVSRLSTL
jgi:hypothetical protein